MNRKIIKCPRPPSADLAGPSAEAEPLGSPWSYQPCYSVFPEPELCLQGMLHKHWHAESCTSELCSLDHMCYTLMGSL